MQPGNPIEASTRAEQLFDRRNPRSKAMNTNPSEREAFERVHLLPEFLKRDGNEYAYTFGDDETLTHHQVLSKVQYNALWLGWQSRAMIAAAHEAPSGDGGVINDKGANHGL